MHFNMKLLVLSTLLICAVESKVPRELLEDWNSLAAPHVEECRKETNINPELTTSLFKNDKLHDDEHFRCYLACLMIKNNFLDKNGVLNRELLLATIKHLTPAIYEKCLAKFDDVKDVCKKAYKMSLCASEENYIK